jgi:hypothetical protein
MKWFNRIAQESVGFCREAAMENSPGALRSRPRPRIRPRGVMEYWSGGVLRRLGIAPRARGVWTAFRAILRLAQPRAKAPGDSLRPFHGQQSATNHQSPITLHLSPFTPHFPTYATRHTVPLPSSVTRRAPSCATATPTGRPQTRLSSITKPVRKSSYSPVATP